MGFETKAKIATFGGQLLKLSHESSTTNTSMNVNVFLPPAAASSSSSTPSKKVPVLFFLSGLTCTPDNCAEKGFLHAAAAGHDIAVVYPDTSPRGAAIAGEDESYDFGSGAGFYIDATREPWSRNYKMESYVTEELPELLFKEFGDRLDKDRVSITGHSMGGHGALTLYLKGLGQGRYKSASAFSPICNPVNCPWGDKAFSGYFGKDSRETEWKRHDATELIRAGEVVKEGTDLRVLIDVGTGDNFYKQGQLLPENLEKAVKERGVKGVEVRYQSDYDHSYFFISTFAKDHVDHAAKYLL